MTDAENAPGRRSKINRGPAPAPPAGRRRPRRGVAGSAAVLVAAGTLAACGGGGRGDPDADLVHQPRQRRPGRDRGALHRGGRRASTRIETPCCRATRASQREQLVRRLAAEDDVDRPHEPRPAVRPRVRPGRVPRAGAAGDAQEARDGVVQSAVEGATWDDELVAIPFWANTQLLWYRKSVAEAAGLDMTQPVTWDQIVKAAKDQDKLVSAQGAGRSP